MNASMEKHWSKVYVSKETSELGWYEERPAPCLKLLSKCNIAKEKPILDVGAGASTFIDCLIEQGFKNIIATDISEAALNRLKQRLGKDQASLVRWIKDDITNPVHVQNLKNIAVWHDRALLHFLLEDDQRNIYLSTLKKSLKKGGYVIIAAFSFNAPNKCTGLKLKKYDENMLAEFLGEDFDLLEHFDYTYHMPSGDPRPYVYTLFQRKQ